MKKVTNRIKSHGEKDGNEQKTSSQNNNPSSNITLIEGSPFAIYENKIGETGKSEFLVIMGNHRITDETFVSKSDAQFWVKKTDWNTILNVVTVYFNALETQRKIDRKAKLNKITKKS